MRRLCCVAMVCAGLAALVGGCADVAPEEKAPRTVVQSAEGWEWFMLANPVESAHPYLNNHDFDDEAQVVRGPSGAESVRVHFDYVLTERGYDHVEIRDDKGETIQRITGAFRGWSKVIPGEVAYVALVSDYSITDKGYLANAVAWTAPEEEPQGEWISQNLPANNEIVSPNPYPNNHSQKWTITAIPEAQSVRVNFTDFDVERGYDFVYLYDGNGVQMAAYTGQRGNFTSLEVPGNVVTIELVTDYSVQRPGFAVASYEILADITGCTSDEECGEGKRCEQVQCIRWPCPALCVEDNDEPVLCGTRGAGQCGEGAYCHYELNDQCGWADAPGDCRPTPEACTREYRPVCGCDGQTHSNPCTANAQGVSVLHEGVCQTQ